MFIHIFYTCTNILTIPLQKRSRKNKAIQQFTNATRFSGNISKTGPRFRDAIRNMKLWRAKTKSKGLVHHNKGRLHESNVKSLGNRMWCTTLARSLPDCVNTSRTPHRRLCFICSQFALLWTRDEDRLFENENLRSWKWSIKIFMKDCNTTMNENETVSPIVMHLNGRL